MIFTTVTILFYFFCADIQHCTQIEGPRMFFVLKIYNHSFLLGTLHFAEKELLLCDVNQEFRLTFLAIEIQREAYCFTINMFRETISYNLMCGL